MQLTVAYCLQREFMVYAMGKSFQVTQEKDVFPCLVCCDCSPHEQRDSSWHTGVGCSSGCLPHTTKASVYTALCLCTSVLVCVYMCVWAFLPSRATGWHGIRTTTAHSDQNKPHFFTTLAQRPAKQTNQGQQKFHRSMSLQVSYSVFCL